MQEKKITFVTGNQHKLAEVQAILPSVQGKSYDLPELQDLDIKKIVAAKLKAALEQVRGPVIVDDTAFYLDCLSSKDGSEALPGPFIKWFLQTVTNEGVAHLAHRYGKTGARAYTLIGYADKKGSIHFFEGVSIGTVVAPQGTIGFGWDHIFVPDGYTQTFARMGMECKNKVSPRAQAVRKLRNFLSKFQI